MYRLVLFIAIVVSVVSESNVDNEPAPHMLKLVAQVDGKQFYADDATTWTWYTGKALCEQNRMELAEITSKSQWDALQNAGKDAFRYGSRYWVAGRDSRQLSQFVWDKSGVALNPEYVAFDGLIPHLTCLNYVRYSNDPNDSYVKTFDCKGAFYVLCEVRPSTLSSSK